MPATPDLVLSSPLHGASGSSSLRLLPSTHYRANSASFNAAFVCTGKEMRALIASLALVTIAVLASALPVTDLPGYGKVPFPMYSGYINVDQAAGKNLFYWFVQAQSGDLTAPVLLWMNGGPGCSSLYGFLTEHGPFQVEDDGQTLTMNPYAWNRNVHMIFLESPAGVGFSYSRNGNYSTGDDDVAAHNYAFLLGFFEVCFVLLCDSHISSFD